MNAPPAPRWTDAPFPPYSYVPGRFPHPVTDPAGHSYGHAPPEVEAHPKCFEFLYGIDLFNAGFYWEAHEAWEAVWKALGRSGADADFMKGMIKLAAAGVKAREGRVEGVARHAARAAALLRVAAQDAANGVRWGVALPPLIAAAERVAFHPDAVLNPSALPVVPVFSFLLQLDAGSNRVI